MSKILCSFLTMALATSGFASSGVDLPKPKLAEKRLESCTQTAIFSTSVVADCGNGNSVEANFGAKCTATDDNCDVAYALALSCAMVKSKDAAIKGAPKVAELCGPEVGPGGPSEP